MIEEEGMPLLNSRDTEKLNLLLHLVQTRHKQAQDHVQDLAVEHTLKCSAKTCRSLWSLSGHVKLRFGL